MQCVRVSVCVINAQTRLLHLNFLTPSSLSTSKSNIPSLIHSTHTTVPAPKLPERGSQIGAMMKNKAKKTMTARTPIPRMKMKKTKRSTRETPQVITCAIYFEWCAVCVVCVRHGRHVGDENILMLMYV